jgi:phosphatidylserine decarboxylase
MTQVQTSRRNLLRLAGLGAGAAVLPHPSLAGSMFGGLDGDGAAAAGTVPFRVGGWLPSDQAVLNRWMEALVKTVDANPTALHPVLEEFKTLIETDPEIFMLFHQMFEQLPKRPKFRENPIGDPQVRDFGHMLALFNAILTTAPEFNKTGLVGFPINAILDWPMGTSGGSAAFLNDRVNAQFKKVLGEWGKFLSSRDSCYVLGTNPRTGWFGRDAMAAMPGFEKEFKCRPDQPHYGFTSWDDFFTREFRDGRRPIASPNDDSVVVNACESAPYKLATDVKRRDRFWIKAQPYSIAHMLANDERTDDFVGGTVYQAFLSALSYHRWHSPVSGTIVKTAVVDGSYYAEALSQGFDPAGPNESQGYITEVATRALVFIEADNPAIGLMCFLAVGMAEVSTCEITVARGQHVRKGDQLGMFHFGGSTHCLIFRPEVRLDFDLHGQQPGLESSNIEINSRIATVR